MKKRKLISLLTSASLLGLLAGCGGSSSSSSDSSSSEPINLSTFSSLPETMVTNQAGVFEAVVNTGSQAAALALGAGETGSTISAIDFPAASGVLWTQIENTTGLPDCKAGLALSSAQPSCAIKALVESNSDGAKVDGNIQVKTNSQTISLPVKIQFVGAGNTALPLAEVTNVTAIAPDSTTTITLLNPAEKTVALNNVSIRVPDWLADSMQNLKSAVLTHNLDGSRSILYSKDGRAENLSPGQSAVISFDLPGGSNISDAILAHYAELTNNPISKTVSVTAANLRNKISPAIEISAVPGKLDSSATLTDPAGFETLTFTNLANTVLTIETPGIQLDLPSDVHQLGGTCVDGHQLAASGETNDSCTIILHVDATAQPQSNKSLSIHYSDSAGNSFISQASVNVAPAEISIGTVGTSDALRVPESGQEVIHVSISNTGKFNWVPSNLPENYLISPEDQTLAAENIEVLGASLGSSCLSGTPVVPGASCDLAIETNINTAPGDYTLTLTPAQNLTTQQTKSFSVKGAVGKFQFSDGSTQIASTSLQIGGSQAITLNNIGQTPISGVAVNIPSPLTKTDDSCTGSTLVPDASCSFSVNAPDGMGAGNFIISADGTSDAQAVSHTIPVSVTGVNLSIAPVAAISVPMSGNSITEVLITNNSGFDWHPSTNVEDYQLTGTDTTGISMVGTGLSQAYCLAGGVVSAGGTCALGLQVESSANVGSYALNIRQATNLASAQSVIFDVIDNMGFVSFAPQIANIGKGSNPIVQTVTVNNSGNTDITNFYLTEPAELTTANNNCGSQSSPTTLASGSSCSFEVSADNSVTDGAYHYAAFGDAENCANCDGNTQMQVNVAGVTVTPGAIGDAGSIRRPATGNQVTDVSITNTNTQTAWEPSTTSSDHVISCVANGLDTCDTANVTIVAPSSGVSCLTGTSVAANASCTIGIQTNETSMRASYALTLRAHKNLSADSLPVDFSVDSSLGYLAYSAASTGSGLNTTSSPLNLPKRTTALNPDAVVNSITLENKGDTDVTGLTLNTSGQSSDLTVSNDTCGTTIAAHSSCSFDLDVANVDGNYTFTSSADVSSLSNNNASFKAAVGCAYSGVCRVFTSYSVVSGDNNAWMLNKGATAATGTTPVAKANNICANDQNNPNDGGIFKAWLSDSGMNARDNIGYNNLLSYTANWNYNLPIAPTGTLLSGNLVNAINDPRSGSPGAGVKAATNVDGTFTGLDNFASCNNWTSLSNTTPSSGAGAKANWGRQAFTNGNWTAYIYGDGGSFNSSCGATYARPVYCFESQS